MMNLSLTREVEEDEEETKQQETTTTTTRTREHMFDKVVTPSDVGKLNRLVIPKQHAERFFPLDTTTNEKGLLLNFEDLTGKSWRFRYSYWNSSQSYVMTKGWSRFVKDKKLDAGDIVSFQRCVGESSENNTRLFIDWRRRPKIPEFPHFSSGGTMFPRFHNFPTTTSYNLYNPYHHHHHTPREFGYGYLVRSMDQRNSYNPTAVIDSVPVMIPGGARAQGGKRLRLFGVDMECDEATEEEESSSSNVSMPRGGYGYGYDGGVSGGGSSSSLVELRLGSGSEDTDHFNTKKGKSSLSFDLDQ